MRFAVSAAYLCLELLGKNPENFHFQSSMLGSKSKVLRVGYPLTLTPSAASVTHFYTGAY